MLFSSHLRQLVLNRSATPWALNQQLRRDLLSDRRAATHHDARRARVAVHTASHAFAAVKTWPAQQPVGVSRLHTRGLSLISPYSLQAKPHSACRAVHANPSGLSTRIPCGKQHLLTHVSLRHLPVVASLRLTTFDIEHGEPLASQPAS